MSGQFAEVLTDLSATAREDYFNLSAVQYSQDQFDRLREQWYAERGVSSSLSKITSCRSYQSIIELGEKALPLILAQIRREDGDPDHWFVALAAIAGEDPVTEDMLGNTVKMASAWLSWADENDVW